MAYKHCDTCQFCEKESATFWTCRYFPPTVLEEYNCFPVVDKKMWCGKYAPDSIDAILGSQKFESTLTGNVQTFKNVVK